MIPNKADHVVSGNLTGDRAVMGFAEGAEKHLMSLLVNLYSDPILAVIRELANNAWDSHVEAGNTAPIEVILPSPLSPYITIRDRGVGLSVDEIHSLYSKYGASTKRETNEQTGFMGVGSKAPLTYQNQFTTITVKNGVRATVVVSIDEDGAGNMLIVDTAATAQSNGVEIQVPVKAGDARKFEETAREFFSYWEKGRVLINGEQPAHVGGLVVCRAPAQPYTIRLLSETDTYGRTQRSKIVMGGVAYGTDTLAAQALGLPYRYTVVAEVPIGAVEIAPSREALSYTPRTNAVIAKIKTAFIAALPAAVQAEIEQATSPQAAVKAYNRWQGILRGFSGATPRWCFKGKPIPMALVRPPKVRQGGGTSKSVAVDPEPRLLVSSRSSYRMSSVSDVPQIDLSYFEKAVFVKGYDLGKFTSTHKKKLELWSSQQGPLQISSYVLANFDLSAIAEWVDPARMVDWATVNALKLPKKERTASRRLPGSYDIVVKVNKQTAVSSKHGVPGSDIDFTHPVYWFHGNPSSAWYQAQMVEMAEDAFTVVALPANRVDKFKRDNPQIPNVQAALQKHYDAWFAKLSTAERLALSIVESGHWSTIAEIPNLKIEDPDLAAAVKVTKAVKGGDLAMQVRRWNNAVTPAKATPWDNPLGRYAAYNQVARYAGRKEALEYANALYTYRKTGA